MNNLPAEIGKTISGIAEAMKSNPSCLAAVLVTALFAGLIYLALADERQEAHQRTMKLIDVCIVTNEKS